ncbi:hypothetical protein BaRGS_00029005 [Batillaria attramentaria]|uniref:Uncharacterized protein n=1 Tax=Batillaria attramentaria TaxID=370345 RepID=A0ABD0JYC1_9CAEN
MKLKNPNPNTQHRPASLRPRKHHDFSLSIISYNQHHITSSRRKAALRLRLCSQSGLRKARDGKTSQHRPASLRPGKRHDFSLSPSSPGAWGSGSFDHYLPLENMISHSSVASIFSASTSLFVVFIFAGGPRLRGVCHRV